LVTEGFVQSKDSVLATVTGMDSPDMSFKTSGRIASISIKTGDTVKKGQILATLGNEEAKIAQKGTLGILSEIQRMGVDISAMGNDTAKIRSALSSLYDGKIQVLEGEYEKSQVGVSLAEKDLSLARVNLKSVSEISSGTSLSDEQKIAQAENTLTLARNNLENTQKLSNLTMESTEKNAVNALANAYIIARNAKDSVDTILGITSANASKNDVYETYLGAKKPETVSLAVSSFWKFQTSYDQTYSLYQSSIVGKTSIPKETLMNMLSQSLLTLENLRQNLHDTKDVLDNSIDSSIFPADTIATMKNQISTLLSSLELAILTPAGGGVKGSMEAIDTTAKSSELTTKQLEDALRIATENVNLAKTGKSISSSDIFKNIENLKAQVSMKEDALKLALLNQDQSSKNIELTRQEKLSKLAETDARISEIGSKLREAGSKQAEAQMGADSATESMESGIIKAPFDGVVLEKYADVGTTVSAGMPILKLSSNTGKYLKTSIDTTRSPLTLGDIVSMKDEKSGASHTGSITRLDALQDMATRKHAIEIRLANESLQIGDRVMILFGKATTEKQMIIPENALVTKYGTPGVYVLQDGQAHFQLVTVLGRDTTSAAILGLKVGEKIITDGKDNILDGERVE
ncbi:MAG: HlyD family efflux transporter periplasmic adaptor subunit, partial [Candidatus Gracilibacteria bacterium]|nr:HlyD family efflux transporter periplasmic adaptor subunit [Candidatus Gracilibacteria bacterium]